MGWVFVQCYAPKLKMFTGLWWKGYDSELYTIMLLSATEPCNILEASTPHGDAGLSQYSSPDLWMDLDASLGALVEIKTHRWSTHWDVRRRQKSTIQKPGNQAIRNFQYRLHFVDYKNGFDSCWGYSFRGNNFQCYWYNNSIYSFKRVDLYLFLTYRSVERIPCLKL